MLITRVYASISDTVLTSATCAMLVLHCSAPREMISVRNTSTLLASGDNGLHFDQSQSFRITFRVKLRGRTSVFFYDCRHRAADSSSWSE